MLRTPISSEKSPLATRYSCLGRLRAMRRGSLIQLLALGVLIGAGSTAVALLIPWLPPAAATQANRIDLVFWLVTAIAIAIFSIVAAVSIYSVLKFRARPDDDSDGPPIHGHTGLEIVWTAIPAALVTAISIVSGVVLAQIGHLPKQHLTVDVFARQFDWSFSYPAAHNLRAGDLRLPLGQPTLLKMTSADVIHAFFVPEFRQNEDVVPGETTTLVITPTKLGSYPVICNELCGLGHTLMRTQAIVMRPADFQAWLKSQGTVLAAPPAQAGKAVFLNNGCGACHTLAAAGASGKVGPDLDRLAADAKRAKRGSLAQYIRESIVKPNAYLVPGYPANVMPQTFGQLPKAQLDALVAFLVQTSSGKHA
jgi:cytochrome c oxidase subunit 2